MDAPARLLEPESLLLCDAFVRRLARQLVRADDAALDLAQSTWLAWLSHRGAVVTPRALLTSIARRLAGKQRRSAVRRAARERLALVREPAPTPQELLVREEVRARVVACVLLLSPPLRDVVVLRFFEGLPPRAIAVRLALPVETVRTRQKRALHELRARLDADTDGGRAAWAGALLPMLGARAGSLLLASKHGGAAVAKVVAGYLAAAIVMVSVSVWAVAAADSRGSEVASGADVAAVASTASSSPIVPQIGEGAVGELGRVQVPMPGVDGVVASAQSGGAEQPNTSRVVAWPVRFLLVDGEGLATAGAEIRLYAGALREREQGYPAVHVRKADDEDLPFATLVSDAAGRAESLVPCELCVAAAVDPRHPQRRTGEFQVTREFGADYRVVLEDPVVVTGRVLDVAGQPLGGAEVFARPRPMEWTNRLGAWLPASVHAADDGTFAIEMLPMLTHELSARRGGVVLATAAVRVTTRTPEPVLLQVVGRALVHGVVVDDAGRSVAEARVHGMRVPDRDHESSFGPDVATGQWATTAADGSFSIEMPCHGRFALIAAATGFAASREGEVVTEPARPAGHVTLVMQRDARIDGLVVQENGAPLVDAEVSFVPEAAAGHPFGLTQAERFGVVTARRTAQDGSFAAMVHPGTAWTLRVVPFGANRELHYDFPSVAPGTRDVLVRVPDLALRGCVLRGRVRRPDGEALPGFKVQLQLHERNGRSTGSSRGVTIDGDQFWTEPLPLGTSCSVELFYESPNVTLGPSGPVPSFSTGHLELAPCHFGPITLEAPTTECELQVERYGSLRVRVRDRSGRPAVGALVSAHTLGPRASFHPRGITDPDGFVFLPRCAPGTNEVSVWLDRVQLGSNTVLVRASEESAVEIQLVGPSGR